MIQNNAGIFDLLLGPISSESSVAQGGSPIQGDPFGAMLQLLMNRQQGSGAVSTGTVDWASLLQQQSEIGVDARQDTDPFGLVLDRTNLQSINRLPISSPGLIALDGKSVSAMIDDIEIPEFGFAKEAGDVIDSLTKDASGALASDDMSDMDAAPDAGKIAHLTGRDIASLLASRLSAVKTSQSVPVSEGSYRILDTAVKQDALELTVSPKDNPADVVKISLPLDVVDELAVDVSRSNQRSATQNPMRVALNDTGVDSGTVSQLLARLNLKELRISSVQSETTNTDGTLPIKSQTPKRSRGSEMLSEKFTIELTGERLTKTISVQRELPKEAIGARINVLRPTNGNDGQPGDSAQTVDYVSTKSGEGKLVSAPKDFVGLDNLARRLSSVGGKTDMSAAGAEKTLDGHRQADSNQFGSHSIQQSHATQSTAESRTQSPVRFTLPDDIQTGLKPGGRSVTISVDPENLGPARLHLALRDSALTARVTVDTPQARAMVEQSLDQLTQQLQRAGIKVDLIEVNVAGEQAQQQFHERNFGMRSKVRMRDLDNDGTQGAESITPNAPAASRPSAVGPNGVNLYA